MDAVGLMPGIGAFSKGIKAVDAVAATSRAAMFGNSARVGELAAGTRNLFTSGELAGKVDGGIGLLGRKVVLGGTFQNLGVITHESSTMNRLSGIAEAGYHQGQWVGTKGLKLLTGGKVAVSAESHLGILLDAGGKIGFKIEKIKHDLNDAVNPGDRFQAAANSH